MNEMQTLSKIRSIDPKNADGNEDNKQHSHSHPDSVSTHRLWTAAEKGWTADGTVGRTARLVA